MRRPISFGVLRWMPTAPAAKKDEDPNIHGWRGQQPVWVGALKMDAQATAEDVSNFARAIVKTL